MVQLHGQGQELANIPWDSRSLNPQCPIPPIPFNIPNTCRPVSCEEFALPLRYYGFKARKLGQVGDGNLTGKWVYCSQAFLGCWLCSGVCVYNMYIYVYILPNLMIDIDMCIEIYIYTILNYGVISKFCNVAGWLWPYPIDLRIQCGNCSSGIEHVDFAIFKCHIQHNPWSSKTHIHASSQIRIDEKHLQEA